MPNATAPAYLTYIEEWLAEFTNSTTPSNVVALTSLIAKGNHFNITIEYTGDSYTGMNWDMASQSFKMHNDWISTASESDLTFVMLRAAFNSVEIAMLQSNTKIAVPQYNRAMQLRDNRIANRMVRQRMG